MRWKTAVVYDRAGGEHIVFHTVTQDLSAGGAAVMSEQDLMGTEVTLFLARPDRGQGNVDMIRMPAQVVSSAYMTDTGSFRLGLRFQHADHDAQRSFAQELAAASDSTTAAPPAPAAPAPEPTPWPPLRPAPPPVVAPPPPSTVWPAKRAAPPPAAAPMPPPPPTPMPSPSPAGRLAALRELAQARQAAGPGGDPQKSEAERIDVALRKAYDYLKELVDSLNVVKPPFTKTYPLAIGAPPLEGLVWDKGQVDYKVKSLSQTVKLFEQVVLLYRLDGKRQIDVTREHPKHEMLARILTDYRIEHTKKESRNARGMVDATTFSFRSAVDARVALTGNPQTGKIEVSTRHVGRFGSIDHKIDPEYINDDALEELAGFILGESPTMNKLLHRP